MPTYTSPPYGGFFCARLYIMMSSLISHLKKPHILLFVAIVLLGFGLRIYAIDYGLPHLYLPDEEFFISPSLRIADGALNPLWYATPAHTIIYSHGIVFRVINFGINIAQGTSLAASQNYELFTGLFQVTGRLFAVAAGTLHVLLAYLIGRAFSQRAGLIASFLTATSFYLVYHSHIIRPDIPLTLFLLGVIYGWVRISQEPQRRIWYTVLGISLGLAVNTKYPGLFIVPALFATIALLWHIKRFVFKHWLWTAGISVLTSFLTGPLLFLRFNRVLQGVRHEGRSEHGGHDGLSFWEHIEWYFTVVLDWQVGSFLLLFVAAVVIGLVLRIWKELRAPQLQDVQLLSIVLAIVSFVVLTSVLSLHWARWIIPVIPMIFIIAGVGLDRLFVQLRTFFGQRRQRYLVVIGIISVFLLAAPGLRLARMIYGLSQPYTLDFAQEWVESNIAPGANFAIEPFSPHLNDDYESERFPNLSIYKLYEYRNRGFSHLILSEGVYGVIMDPETRSAHFLPAQDSYRILEERATLLEHTKAHPEYTQEELLYSSDFSVLRTLDIRLLLGPYIKIYEVPPKPNRS